MSNFSRRDFLGMVAGGAAVAVALVGVCSSPLEAMTATVKKDSNKMNVLFIVDDDLRPQLGCYGQKQMKTPNIDRLAKQGMVFEHAYCQWPVCGPSRASLLSGLRPDAFGQHPGGERAAEMVSDKLSLPGIFYKNGYYTVSLGKIYHGKGADLKSWSEEPWLDPLSEWNGYVSQETEKLRQKLWEERGKKGWYSSVNGRPVEITDLPDDQFRDGRTALKAIEVMRRVKDKPFFLAVGFVKPHLPFACPKKYWDYYKESDIEMAKNPFRVKGSPDYVYIWSELSEYYGMPQKGLPSEETARELVHGYYACVSFADAQVGLLLDELNKLGLRDNTVIVFWGDHGWHLGDQGIWGKHTNYEKSTHVPLIISLPGQKTAGQKTDALVEFVDIYPTLAELCGLEVPDYLDGKSMVPLLENPSRPWKKGAFTQWQYWEEPYDTIMGYTVRTDRYRYIEWQDCENNNKAVAAELYDYSKDPEETVNIADKAKYAKTVKELSKMIENYRLKRTEAK
jgi:arylsulfatase A-like enzyme